MEINQCRIKGKIFVSQTNYILKLLDKFSMSQVKAAKTSVVGYFTLASTLSPSNDDKKDGMDKLPYASATGSVCTPWFAQDPTWHMQQVW